MWLGLVQSPFRRWAMSRFGKEWFWILTLFSLTLRVLNQTTDLIYTQHSMIQNTGAPNYAEISIVDENSTNQITSATVGDLVRIKINASTSRSLGFSTVGVTGCAAYDGNPADDKANYSFNLIGDNGCNDAPSFYDPFKAAELEATGATPFYGMNVNAGVAFSDHFKIFKFPGQEQVWFKCSLFFCVGDADDRCQHTCSASGRRKRSAEPWWAGIHIDGESEEDDGGGGGGVYGDGGGRQLVLEVGEYSSVVINVRSTEGAPAINFNNVIVPRSQSTKTPCDEWEKFLTYFSIALTGILVAVLFACLKHQSGNNDDNNNNNNNKFGLQSKASNNSVEPVSDDVLVENLLHHRPLRLKNGGNGCGNCGDCRHCCGGGGDAKSKPKRQILDPNNLSNLSTSYDPPPPYSVTSHYSTPRGSFDHAAFPRVDAADSSGSTGDASRATEAATETTPDSSVDGATFLPIPNGDFETPPRKRKKNKKKKKKKKRRISADDEAETQQRQQSRQQQPVPELVRRRAMIGSAAPASDSASPGSRSSQETSGLSQDNGIKENRRHRRSDTAPR